MGKTFSPWLSWVARKNPPLEGLEEPPPVAPASAASPVAFPHRHVCQRLPDPRGAGLAAAQLELEVAPDRRAESREGGEAEASEGWEGGRNGED